MRIYSIVISIFLYALSTTLWAQTESGQVAKGKQLYQAYGCALCHGWQGSGDGIRAKEFDPSPTDFHRIKAYRHGVDDASIRRSISYGIKEDNSLMPAFEDIPSQELESLVRYLKSLQHQED